MAYKAKDLDKVVQYTTGQVAKICGVAPRTAAQWVDKGILKGQRLPGSKDRRVNKSDLLKFMLEHHLPMGSLRLEALGLSMPYTDRTEVVKCPEIKQVASCPKCIGTVCREVSPDTHRCQICGHIDSYATMYKTVLMELVRE